MGTKYNRYYNDPNIGAAFSNLASIFAPPDPTDELAYAQAAKARLETQGLGDLYGLAADPNADAAALDRLGAATGQWSPTSGFGARNMASADRRYGVDVGASTARRGQDIDSSDRRYGVDVGARTTLSTNALDNKTRAITGLFGPMSQGQVRPAVPDEFMSAIGLPGADAVAGAPKPLSTDEVEGQQLLEAIAGGQYGPTDAATAAKSDVPVEQIVGESGAPVFATRADAVGRQPYINPGSAPAQKFVTYKTPDGRTGTAVANPVDGSLLDQASREPLPPGTITGEVTDTGGGALTTGAQGDIERQAFALTGALSTTDKLADLVRTSPSSQGIVGRLRGTAQDVIQTGDELGQAFGGTLADVQNSVASGLTDAGLAQQFFDPNIPAIEMLTNMLAWQYAKSVTGDRVSNDAFRSAKMAVGGDGWLSNQADTLARLDAFRKILEENGGRMLPLLRDPAMKADLDTRLRRAPTAPSPTANGQRPRAQNPQTGEVVEFDGQQWVPVQ